MAISSVTDRMVESLRDRSPAGARVLLLVNIDEL